VKCVSGKHDWDDNLIAAWCCQHDDIEVVCGNSEDLTGCYLIRVKPNGRTYGMRRVSAQSQAVAREPTTGTRPEDVHSLKKAQQGLEGPNI
jgi:hypothetical protein